MLTCHHLGLPEKGISIDQLPRSEGPMGMSVGNSLS